MKKLISAVVLLALLACSREEVTRVNEPQEAQPQQLQEPQVLQAEVYLDEDLTFRVEENLKEGSPATKASVLEGGLEGLDILSMERMFPDAGEFEPRHRAAGLHKWYVITYTTREAATKAEASLADVPGVETVRPVRKASIQSTVFFNDPEESRQWHYHNDGTVKGGKAGVDVNVIPVWNNITTGDPNVVVAVIDTGIDYAHEDLSAHVNRPNSWNFRDNTGSLDPGDHGTHVAGTISAVNNNEIGVAGIAGGNAAEGKAGTTLISCEVFNPEGSAGSGHEQALVWAADHGAVLANNSWGYNYWDKDHKEYDAEEAKRDHEFYLQPNEGEYHDALKDAVDYFNKFAGLDKEGRQVGPMAGGAVFFSAGNEGNEYGPPSEYEGIISVGAVGPGGVIASYSCFGDWVDLAAPGGDSRYDRIYSTKVENSYGYMQGTSMACPHVTGVAALVVAACGGPGFTREMLLDKLLNGTSTRVDVSSYRIGQMVDAWNAINYGDVTPPDKVTTLSLEAQSNTLTAIWKVTGHGKVPAAGFLVHYSANKESLEASTPTARKEGVFEAVYGVSSEKIGDVVILPIRDLDFQTEYYVRVYAYNTSRIFSDPSSTVSARTAVNNPPTITPRTDISNLRIKASETLSVQFDVVDPDGHAVTVTHTPGSEADTWRSNLDGTYSLQITGPKATEGTYTAHILVEDTYGASAELDVKYTILENHAPKLAKQFENQLLTEKAASFSLVLADYFSDEDGDNLTYSATNTSESAVHVTANSGKLIGTAISNGLATVTVTAKDPLGKSVTTEFKVAVRTGDVVVSAYPNPVTDYLYISTPEVTPQSVNVRIVSATGGLAYNASVTASAFEPAKIDMTQVAPGVYSLTVTYGGQDYKQTVVKK